jgi:hypothetical protein
MTKKVPLLLLLIVCFSACSNNKQKNGCGVQTCTLEYAYIGILFKDQQNKFLLFKDVTMLNLRTHKPLTPVKYPPAMDFVPGYTLIASDDNIKDFSTDGDDVKISATNSETNQTKTAILKIAGGCGCHVSKKSGPDTIVFD